MLPSSLLLPMNKVTVMKKIHLFMNISTHTERGRKEGCTEGSREREKEKEQITNFSLDFFLSRKHFHVSILLWVLS